MTIINKISSIISGKDERLTEPVFVDSDGVEIEDASHYVNVTIVNSSEKTNTIMSRLDSFVKTRETISKLISVLETINKENKTREKELLESSIKDLLSQLDGYESSRIALESAYGEVTQEGVWDFVKDVWSRIIELIKSFFRAIFDFIKSLFKSEDLSSSNGKKAVRRMDNFLKSGLLIDEPSKVSSNLPFLLNLQTVTEINLLDLMEPIETMEHNYKELLETHIQNVVNELAVESVEQLSNMFKDLSNRDSTINDMLELNQGFDEVISIISKKIDAVLPYEVSIGDLPKETYSKIHNDKVSSVRYKVKSLIDRTDQSRQLSAMFNIYGRVADASISDYDELFDYNLQSVIDTFTVHTEEANNKNKKSIVKGPSDLNEYEVMKSMFEKYSEKIDFSKMKSILDSAYSRLDALTKVIQTRTRPMIDKFAGAVEGNVFDVETYKNAIRNDHVRMNVWSNLVDLFLPKDRSLHPEIERTETHRSFASIGRQAFDMRVLYSVSDKKDPVMKETVEKVERFLSSTLLKLPSFGDDLILARTINNEVSPFPGLDTQMVEEVRSLTDDEKLAIRHLDDIFDKVVIGLIRALMNITNLISVEVPKNYTRYREELSRVYSETILKTEKNSK